MQEVTWQDASWHGDTDWDAVHAVIGSMPDHERGWYHGLFDGLTYAQAQVNGGKLRQLVVDAPEGYGYSPSGAVQDAEGFYAGIKPPPPDFVEVKFNPLKFLCLAAELDREAAIIYIRFEQGSKGFFGRYVRIGISTTESHYGLPSSWPKMSSDRKTEIWRPFRHAAKLVKWLEGE